MASVLSATRRAILYDRVSTIVQSRNGYSGGADGYQIDRCQSLAESRGYHVVGTISDVGSGASWDIAGIMDALDRARRREYDVLVVSDTSRFARSMAKKLVYEHQLARHGVTVLYANQPEVGGDGTPDERLVKNMMGGMFGALDEYDRDKRAWMTSQGRVRKAQGGLVVGGGPAPYGFAYVTTRNEDRKRDIPVGLALDPEQAPVVERIYREALTLSAVTIAEGLNEDGIAPPSANYRRTSARFTRKWATSTVRRILTHAVYDATYCYGEIRIAVPRIVDAATVQRARARLSGRKTTRAPRSEDRGALWTLRGLLECGACGGAFAANSVSLSGRAGDNWPEGRQRLYSCARSLPSSAKRQGHTTVCAARTLLAADERISTDGLREMEGIEDVVWGALVEHVLTPGMFEATLATYNAGSIDVRDAWHEGLAIIDEQLATQTQRMRRAEEAKLDYERDDPRYEIQAEASTRATGLVRKLKAEREAYAASGGPGLSDASQRELVALVDQFRAIADIALEVGAEHAGPTIRRRVFESFGLRVVVKPAAEGEREAIRLGRGTWVNVDVFSALSGEQGLLNLCFSLSSSQMVLTAVA